MNALRTAGKSILALTFILAIYSFANAQPAAFVASTGTDSGTCPRTAPCRSFQFAVNAVATNGIVVALDSAGFGPVTIAKNVSIVADSGAVAAINATSGTAVNITSGNVTLAGLTINGNGSATTGVGITGGKVNIHNSQISNFTNGVSATAAGKAFLSNTRVLNNTTALYANGEGTDGTTTSTVLIFVGSGEILNNGTAFVQDNPGASKWNIVVYLEGNSSADVVAHLAGNTTLGSGSGTGCPCLNPGMFTGLTNPK